MKNLFKKIKEFYDTYKIIIWILPLFGGAIYDRFVNMWNVPEKVETYKEIFIKKHSKDSAMYVRDKIKQDSINKVLLNKQCSCTSEIKKSKTKPNEQLSVDYHQANLPGRRKR